MNAFVKSIEVPQRSVKIKYILDTSHFNTSFLKCAGWEGLISGIWEKKLEHDIIKGTGKSYHDLSNCKDLYDTELGLSKTL